MSSITKAMSFDSDATPPFTWVHFEGRNIYETAAQIDWLESKATREGWRSQLTISIELEKPDRPHIDVLLTRVGSSYIYIMFLYSTKPSLFIRVILYSSLNYMHKSGAMTMQKNSCEMFRESASLGKWHI
jgi:ketohexokinase